MPAHLRLLMMGTGDFAAPLFRALYKTPHEVVALVTQPRRTARPEEAPATPMRDIAAEHGTPILDPESVNTDESRETLRRFEPDLLIVADYGQILSAETLAVARLGGLNLHGSLLPKYRGAAPINWAIYNGDAETGVTVIHMTPRVDAGPTLGQARTPIDLEETAVELERRLAEMGAPLLVKVIEEMIAGRTAPLSQDPSQASPARRLRKTDGAVDWSRPAAAVKNQIRALEPWPRTHTFWHRPNGPSVRLILGRSTVVDEGATTAEPGTVVRAGADLVVATGGGGLQILELQPAGKRMLATAEFLRGYPVKAGERFGPPR
jgi:methionyl-tRNA formyltransferase